MGYITPESRDALKLVEKNVAIPRGETSEYCFDSKEKDCFQCAQRGEWSWVSRMSRVLNNSMELHSVWRYPDTSKIAPGKPYYHHSFIFTHTMHTGPDGYGYEKGSVLVGFELRVNECWSGETDITGQRGRIMDFGISGHVQIFDDCQGNVTRWQFGDVSALYEVGFVEDDDRFLTVEPGYIE
jgi:hypothetical protein